MLNYPQRLRDDLFLARELDAVVSIFWSRDFNPAKDTLAGLNRVRDGCCRVERAENIIRKVSQISRLAHCRESSNPKLWIVWGDGGDNECHEVICMERPSSVSSYQLIKFT